MMLYRKTHLFLKNSHYFGNCVVLKAIANKCVKKRVLTRLWSLERVRSSSWVQKKASGFEKKIGPKKMEFLKYCGFYGRLRRKFRKAIAIKNRFSPKCPKISEKMRKRMLYRKTILFLKNTEYFGQKSGISAFPG